jgi:predicted ester cyclase
MNPNELKNFIKQYFATIDSGDIKALADLISDDHVMHFPMSPVPLNKEGHLQTSQAFINAFSDMKHTCVLSFSDGEWVAMKGSFSGKHTGEFNGIPATNKVVTFGFTDLMKVRNGKNVEEWVDIDSVGLLTQLGVIPSAQEQPA